MAYLPAQNIYLVEIPKCGSRSLIKAAENTNDKLIACGHYSISRMIQEAGEHEGARVVAVIRDPVERLMSAINYTSNPSTLDNRLYSLYRRGLVRTTVMTTQSSYLDDTRYPIRLYPFEDINGAISDIGSRPCHENKAPHTWSSEDIRSHELFPEIMAFYKEDEELRMRLFR